MPLDESRASVELYTLPDGAVSLQMHFDGETVWATQAQMAELFGTSRRNVGLHLENAYAENELDESTRKDFFQVRQTDEEIPFSESEEHVPPRRLLKPLPLHAAD